MQQNHWDSFVFRFFIFELAVSQRLWSSICKHDGGEFRALGTLEGPSEYLLLVSCRRPTTTMVYSYSMHTNT